MHPNETSCICYKPPFNYKDYTELYMGTDKTNGRFADVTVQTCKHCGTNWLRYFVEFESFSKSGRWYKGIIGSQDLTSVTPLTTVAYLESLQWYIFGGSYFDSTGAYGKGKLLVDL